MKQFSFFLGLLVLLLHLPQDVATQTIINRQDSVIASSRAVSFYLNELVAESVLYEGREYLGFDNKIGGHAFFQTNTWQQGSMRYKGQYYHNVPLLYDIAAEELVIRHSGGLYKIKLIKQQLEHFTLGNHHFIRLDTVDARGVRMPAGFYELAYSGRLRVLIKRKKAIEESVKDMRVRQTFIAADTYYIHKGGIYHAVSNKRTALQLMQDRKKELRQHLRKHHIFYKKDPELALTSMAAHYDQLTQNNQ